MQAEYRVIATATFDTAAKRDAAYDLLKAFFNGLTTTQKNTMKRADMTKDDYLIPDLQSSEKVI